MKNELLYFFWKATSNNFYNGFVCKSYFVCTLQRNLELTIRPHFLC